MKRLITLISLILLVTTPVLAQVQPSSTPTKDTVSQAEKQKTKFREFLEGDDEQISLFPKKEKKKDVIKQRDDLLFVVDSLNQLLHEKEFAPAIDTASLFANFEAQNGYSIDSSILSSNTDSLLDTWYFQRQLSIAEAYKISAIDSVIYTSEIPDSVFINRLNKMNSFISSPYNKTIRQFIVYYITKMQSASKVVGLSEYYMPIFEEIFDQHDLPLELKAMAIIESALNPVAVSRAKARGMWQFMYATGKQYGLEVTSYVDERYDYMKSGHAAAQYLDDSYKVFGDWLLAIASYNCGLGNVNRAIRRAGGSKDFWEIYPYLPRETRGYVPSFIAALYLLEYHEEHNIMPETVDMPVYVDTLKINKMLHFDQIAHYTEIPKDLLKSLNPQYLHDIIPGSEKEYVLRLPHSYVSKFVDNEDVIYDYKKDTYFSPVKLQAIKSGAPSSGSRITHTVRKGETLGHIAMRYKVSVNNIKSWNNVGNMIRVGQRLAIYTSGSAPSSSSASTSVSGGYVMYTVKRGDNLWEISKKFSGVSMNSIMQLNGLNSRSKIYPGKKLKIKRAS